MNKFLILPLALLIAGCASAPTHYFALDSMLAVKAAPGASDRAYVVVLRPLPPMVDRPQLVVEEADHEVEILQHERWAAPLRDQVESVLVRNLRAAFGTDNVDRDARLVSGAAPAIITIEIERFEARAGEVVIAARWQWHVPQGDAVMVRSGIFSQPVSTHSAKALTQGWSQALADLSVQIAGSVTQ